MALTLRAAYRPGIALAMAGLVLVLAALAGAAALFTLSERQLAGAEAKHGQHARKRLEGWLNLIATSQGQTEKQKLETVNQFFNERVLFISDIEHWSMQDYWATPTEFLATGGGDCEDYAIAKYFTLMALGVSMEKLRITYVKAQNWNPINQAHMVLTYYATPGAMPLVLDNLIPEIKPAVERRDLVPVYSFNGEGLWLAKERGSGKVASGPGNIGLWRSLTARMGREFD